jgi:hypothetical protein
MAWNGSDANERAYNSVHNGLVNIIIDGPTERSPEILEKAKKVLADLNRQTPPKRAQISHDARINQLRRMIYSAEEVISGRRAPTGTGSGRGPALRASGGLAASDMNFQNGERIRIRVIGPKGQLADPPFWYTVTGTMSVEDVALQFTQTIQPGMFVSISDGKNSWTFQKETHAGKNSVRRTHKLPTARYREASETGGRRVADFNTLDDLIAHARDELGATHASGAEARTKLYFPRGGQYEEATVWRKEGYWHAQGPGSRNGVSKLPSDARSIRTQGGRRAAESSDRLYHVVAINERTKKKEYLTKTPVTHQEGVTMMGKFTPHRDVRIQLEPVNASTRREAPVGRHAVRDYEAIDRRDRVIAGPFKSYGDAKDAAGPAGAVRFVPSRGKPSKATEAKRSPARAAGGAEEAGKQYAYDQVQSDHFMDWVRDQMLEARKSPSEDVLPLETKADALKVARNMLQQLEWDTRRELRKDEITDLIGEDGDIAEFWEGFRETSVASRDWLADELLEIKSEMSGGGVVEAPHGKLKGMKPVADMTESELLATIRACELRLNGPSRGITTALRESLLSRIENCRAELMVRGRKEEGLDEKKRRRPKAERSARRRR